MIFCLTSIQAFYWLIECIEVPHFLGLSNSFLKVKQYYVINHFVLAQLQVPGHLYWSKTLGPIYLTLDLWALGPTESPGKSFPPSVKTKKKQKKL